MIMTKLFVSGFALNISELELVQLFGMHADVSTIKIVRDKKTGVCKGYAFLEIVDRAAAERAVEALDNTAVGDRLLTVKIKEEDPYPPMNTSWPNAKKIVKRTPRPESTPSAIKQKRPRKLL
jgi:RNA recognition motif-containing protein